MVGFVRLHQSALVLPMVRQGWGFLRHFISVIVLMKGITFRLFFIVLSIGSMSHVESPGAHVSASAASESVSACPVSPTPGSQHT